MTAPIRIERRWNVDTDELMREICDEQGAPFQPWEWLCVLLHGTDTRGLCNFDATHAEAVDAGFAHLAAHAEVPCQADWIAGAWTPCPCPDCAKETDPR